MLEREPLSKIASTLLSIPPSSASIERIWSQFSAVHSKSRNRLKNARVNKQVFIKSNYHVFDRDCEPISYSDSENESSEPESVNSESDEFQYDSELFQSESES